MSSDGWMQTQTSGAEIHVSAGGVWAVTGSADLDRITGSLNAGAARTATFDLSAIDQLDSAGAYLIHRTVERLRAEGLEVELTGVSERHKPLLDIVFRQGEESTVVAPAVNPLIQILDRLGRSSVEAAEKGVELLNFVGVVTVTFTRALRQPARFRPKALITQMEQTGLDALPIVGLLSFLVGVVLAYLMSDQLRQFGAEVFTVNLVGLSMLREVAVLITAIMIAGRSGSAFTAQIGTMKVNEELDAMGTLGLDPVEVLVLPRVIALMITLPFLTFFADVMGVLGGGVMTVLALDLTPAQFVTALKGAIDLNDFLVGMVKAPVHAYIIALVGCYEGLKVQRTAESVGRQTTTSVVESIFLVIVATALFSILFSTLGI
ncbi:MAG: MlaE family lipid ABC transporter permease subunit [Alphaproteobacteria bacterium]